MTNPVKREEKAHNVFANEQKRTRLDELSVMIDAQIREHNDLATEMDEDLIIAYKMTHDDLNKMMKEVSDVEQSEVKSKDNT